MKPWLKQMWCIPPTANAAFVCAMEDILEIYRRPYNGDKPLVCMDELAKQLIKEICDRIELGKDNQTLFDLLVEFKESDVEGLKSILQKFQTASDAAARGRSKILKEELAQTYFISGSAVVANLENDAEWQKEAGEIRTKFSALLDKEKAKLLAE